MLQCGPDPSSVSTPRPMAPCLLVGLRWDSGVVGRDKRRIVGDGMLAMVAGFLLGCSSDSGNHTGPIVLRKSGSLCGPVLLHWWLKFTQHTSCFSVSGQTCRSRQSEPRNSPPFLRADCNSGWKKSGSSIMDSLRICPAGMRISPDS